MAYHHLAVAARDMKATHLFYTEAMGFELVKVNVAKTPGGGWAKHFFYDTGGGELMAFWELHDDSLPQDFETGLARAAGLPDWVNHIAFGAEDLAGIEKCKQRWLDNGYSVMEIDHGWCTSIYTNDPGGTLVEFCTTTEAFSAEDRQLALRAVTNDDLEFESDPGFQVYESENPPVHERSEI
jgi:catechol 2,3-dioxygenase-like lactoylglutathione lyase family enzyme